MLKCTNTTARLATSTVRRAKTETEQSPFSWHPMMLRSGDDGLYSQSVEGAFRLTGLAGLFLRLLAFLLLAWWRLRLTACELGLSQGRLQGQGRVDGQWTETSGDRTISAGDLRFRFHPRQEKTVAGPFLSKNGVPDRWSGGGCCLSTNTASNEPVRLRS